MQKGTNVNTTLDTRAFRQIVGQFPTGVSVVAAEVQGEIHGMTVNSLTSLSLSPMLMLFCIDKKTKMAGFIQNAQEFTISILREEQQPLSTYFAGAWKQEKAPPFRFLEWTGGPRLEGCVAAVGCRLHKMIEVGDHYIVTGETIALHLGSEPRSPLVFHGGLYRRLDGQENKPAPELENGRMDVRVFYDPWDEA